MTDINKEKKVCVLMPVYNGEKTIKMSIASLINQSHENWELIVVDDGSTDDTRIILDSLKDRRIRVYHLESNMGRGYARDFALKKADGDYLAYLDADDMLHHEKIRKQIYVMENNPEVMLVSTGCVTIKNADEPLRVSSDKPLQGNFTRYGQALPLLLGATMARLDHAKKFSYNHHLDVSEDYDFFARCGEGFNYANIAEPLYYYRVGDVSVKKILYYQIRSIQLCLEYAKYGLYISAIKRFILKIVKIVSYCIVIPVCGVDRVLNARGYQHSLSEIQMNEYMREISKIKRIAQSL